MFGSERGGAHTTAEKHWPFCILDSAQFFWVMDSYGLVTPNIGNFSNILVKHILLYLHWQTCWSQSRRRV